MPRAAFDIALLLQNNPELAIAAARRAFEALERLQGDDQVALLRFLVELHRRSGEREEARRVLTQLRSIQ